MFAVWLAYGVWQWRRSSEWLKRSQAVPAPKRPLRATLWLLGGAAGILGVLYAVFLGGGFPDKGIAPWAWPICLVAGVGFVHSQVTAAALLVSAAVTSAASEPSQSRKE